MFHEAHALTWCLPGQDLRRQIDAVEGSSKRAQLCTPSSASKESPLEPKEKKRHVVGAASEEDDGQLRCDILAKLKEQLGSPSPQKTVESDQERFVTPLKLAMVGEAVMNDPYVIPDSPVEACLDVSQTAFLTRRCEFPMPQLKSERRRRLPWLTPT